MDGLLAGSERKVCPAMNLYQFGNPPPSSWIHRLVSGMCSGSAIAGVEHQPPEGLHKPAYKNAGRNRMD